MVRKTHGGITFTGYKYQHSKEPPVIMHFSNTSAKHSWRDYEKKIPLNNSNILEKLEEAHWYRQPHILEHFHQSGSGFNSKDADHFTSHEYFHKIRDMKRNHDGFRSNQCVEYATLYHESKGRW